MGQVGAHLLCRETVCLDVFGSAETEGPSRERLTLWNEGSQVRPPLETHRRVERFDVPYTHIKADIRVKQKLILVSIAGITTRAVLFYRIIANC